MGYVRTEEHNQRMSELKKQQFKNDPTIALRIGNYHRGKPKLYEINQSQEVREKRSKSIKAGIASGKIKVRKGIEHPTFKFRTMTADGYWRLRINGKYILEHRYIIEGFLGRKLLRQECVHHINGVKTDNRLENLEVLSNKEHRKRHAEEDRLRKWFLQQSLS